MLERKIEEQIIISRTDLLRAILHAGYESLYNFKDFPLIKLCLPLHAAFTDKLIDTLVPGATKEEKKR